MEAGSNDGARTFAAYLARNFIAKKGYVAGAVPEAAGLAAASDIVLTRSDGMSFGILCMIDCEANPGKRFEMSREALEEIGKACLKHAGKVHGTQMPITIQIMEVGRTQVTSTDQERLKAFKRKSMFSKVVIHAWIVAPNEASVWTNMAFNGRFGGRKFIEQLLGAPRIPDAGLTQAAPVAMTRVRFPILTCALLAVLAAVFAAEHLYGIGAASGLLAPGIQTLVALGGLNSDLVLQSGEWYRIFSAALLHGDLLHLLLNGLALYLAGTVLESLVGRAWFFALFVIGAVGGSLLSLALNPASVVSVGASGAIMGLLAAAFVCSFRIPAGVARTQIQMAMLQVLVPSLIPLAVSRTGAQVDFAGHLGGALSGALVGMAMLKGWRPTNAHPGLAPLAAAISLAGFAAFAIALFPIARQYPSYALDTLLIPRAQLPELPGAESALRAGLAEEQILRTKFSPDLESRMRTMLALVLLDRGQAAEARAAARPVCSTVASGPIRDALDRERLCGDAASP